MSEVRVNFLNWRPDQDDFNTDGLITADNVIHETEGYKPVHLMSTGSFATSGGLTSVTSIMTKPIHVRQQHLSAWLANDTLQVGIDGTATGHLATGFPASFGTTGSNQVIFSFQVANLNEQVFYVANAAQEQVTPTTDTIGSFGYAVFNI